MIEPSVLGGRARYERVMDGFTDNTHDDAFTHTVRLAEPDRTLELRVVALPSPEYLIREACAYAVDGDVDPAAVAAVPSLGGVRMVGGLTRTVADAVGKGPSGTLLVDAAIEVARLARQVAKLPREQANRAASGDPLECWGLDTTGWVDLPDSCFTYSAQGRALFGTRTVVSPMQPDLYSPRPGQSRVFVRRKVARIERADSVTSRLPYAGICSEPQGKIKALIGETVDGTLRKRLSGHVGGVSGCAQLFDLTADLLKLLA